MSKERKIYFTDICYNNVLEEDDEYANSTQTSTQTLPFSLQMKVFQFRPNLPFLPPLFWKYIRNHYDRRNCKQCGRFLPMSRKRFYCLCQRFQGKKGNCRYTVAFTFDDELSHRNRHWKTRVSPGILFSKPSISFRNYIDKIYDYLERVHRHSEVIPPGWYYITSCQPYLIVSFLKFCHLPWDRYAKSPYLLNYVTAILERQQHQSSLNPDYHPEWLFERVVNTNTHLRGYMDMFHKSPQNRKYFYDHYPGIETIQVFQRFHGFHGNNRTQNKGVISLKCFLQYYNYYNCYNCYNCYNYYGWFDLYGVHWNSTSPFSRTIRKNVHYFFHGKDSKEKNNRYTDNLYRW